VRKGGKWRLPIDTWEWKSRRSPSAAAPSLTTFEKGFSIAAALRGQNTSSVVLEKTGEGTIIATYWGFEGKESSAIAPRRTFGGGEGTKGTLGGGINR